MRVTHAIILKSNGNMQFDKKSKCDQEVFEKQQDILADTLRESGRPVYALKTGSMNSAFPGVRVIDIPIEGDCSTSAFLAGDAAVVVNGTALICRPNPKHKALPLKQIATVLRGLSFTTFECPQEVNGKAVVLEGSDVLYTGKELFVGIRKHGTNIQGASVLARVFCDVSVVPVMMSEKWLPLTFFVSISAPGVLTISKSRESANIIRKMEQSCSFQYKTLTLDDPEAVNTLCVNNRIIFRQDNKVVEPILASLQTTGFELWAIDVSEIVKAGAPFSRHCILVKQLQRSQSLSFSGTGSLQSPT